MSPITNSAKPKKIRNQILTALASDVAKNSSDFCTEMSRSIQSEISNFQTMAEQYIFVQQAIKEIHEAALVSRFHFNYQKPEVQKKMRDMLIGLVACLEEKFQYLLQSKGNHHVV